MMNLPILDDITKILFVLILATAVLIITVRTLSSLFNVIHFNPGLSLPLHLCYI